MVRPDFLLQSFYSLNQVCCRSTTKDDDDDDEKPIDQPEKRKRDESFISLEPRSDNPGAHNNDTFEGAIGNFIRDGFSSGTVDPNAIKADEFNIQGLPDW